MTPTAAPAFFAEPVRIGPVEVIAAPQLAELEDAAAHLRAVMDITRAKNKAEAVAIVAAKTEQLKRAYSTIDHIARCLRVPPHKAADAVEHAVRMLDEAYSVCASCSAWITDGPGHKTPDPGHCGDDGSQAAIVTVCNDCYQDAEGIGIGGSVFERARR